MEERKIISSKCQIEPGKIVCIKCKRVIRKQFYLMQGQILLTTCMDCAKSYSLKGAV